MTLRLFVAPLLLSLCFSLPAVAGTANEFEPLKTQTIFLDGRAAKLPADEFPEPIEVSFGLYFASI